MEKYPFEEKAYSRIEGASTKLRKILGERLNTKDAAGSFYDFSGVERYKIEAFLSTFNGNISWYEKAILEEKSKVSFYIRVTIFLITLIPILVFAITFLSTSLKLGNIEVFGSILAALLTSIIGLHKVATLWMDRRKFLGIYQRASSDLKSKFYEFEYFWNNKLVYDSANSKLHEEFDTALEQVVMEGRKTASDERKAYYEALENPSIDVGNIISSSFTNASSILSSFQSKKFERRVKEQEEEMNEIKERKALTAEVKALKNDIPKLKRHLIALRSNLGSAPSADQPSIQSGINALLLKIQEKEIELVEKNSRL